jgi:hypothetical protein
MLDAVIAWQAFGVALLVFGFAPGALLRRITLAFPRDDPRRNELRAELYTVPRLERPFWVLEQLEVALFEGVWARVAKASSQAKKAKPPRAASTISTRSGLALRRLRHPLLRALILALAISAGFASTGATTSSTDTAGGGQTNAVLLGKPIGASSVIALALTDDSRGH